MADFNKVGLLVLKQSKILLCRKDNFTSRLIIPGGQVEDGESDADCLVREIREELAVGVTDLAYLGTYEDRAASDDPQLNKTVQIRLFTGALTGIPTASAEIKDIVWFGKANSEEDLSPIIKNKIIPDLRLRGWLDW